MSRSSVFRSQRFQILAPAALVSALTLVAACTQAPETPKSEAAPAPSAVVEPAPVVAPMPEASPAAPIPPTPEPSATLVKVAATGPAPRNTTPATGTPAPAVPRPAPVQSAGLPAGPGRETTMRLCSNCHTIDTVTARGRTGAEWGEIITQMTNLGLNASDADLDEVQAYLTRAVPPR